MLSVNLELESIFAKKSKSGVGIHFCKKVILNSSELKKTVKQTAIKLQESYSNMGIFVARPGFEPRQTVPKTVVLPLYYRAILSLKAGLRAAKVNTRCI